MTQIQVEIPKSIAKQFSHQSVVSYKEIIENYENSFEYESVNMKAKDFKDFLLSELSHD